MLRDSHRFPLAHSVEMPIVPARPQASFPPDNEPPPLEPPPAVTQFAHRYKLDVVAIRERH
jgi:hypothetical protein